MVYSVKDKPAVRHLFEGWENTIVWASLYGPVGYAFADDPETPVSAAVFIGDFCFLAGEPNRELVAYKPEAFLKDAIFMAPTNVRWHGLIEAVYGDAAKKRERYAIKREGTEIFDIPKLERIVAELDKAYTLRMIDEELYHRILGEDWVQDLCSNFERYDLFAVYGLGFVVLEGDKIVSGASSYAASREVLEIEIDTHEEYRRQGLALVCGARLILECLKLGIYPDWDAHNKGSVALAEKLGYHYDGAYPVYWVENY